jgi:hypothetical protein
MDIPATAGHRLGVDRLVSIVDGCWGKSGVVSVLQHTLVFRQVFGGPLTTAQRRTLCSHLDLVHFYFEYMA